MKRFVIATIIAFCAFAVATSPVFAQSKPTITIWWAQWAPADGLQELGHEFERNYGIAVKVHQIPWGSFQDQVFLNFGNKQTDFDIVVGDSQWIGRGATKGLYVDLTGWLPSAVDLKTVHPRAAKYLCEYPPGSGKYYAAPCETDAVGFAYRRDWFENAKERDSFNTKYGRELAAPATWDEFRDVAEFFTRPDAKRYGCALLTGRSYDSLVMGYQHFLWAWGGAWADARTHRVKGVLNAKAAADGLEFMKGLMKFSPPGGSNFDYAKTPEALVNGSVAMAMNYYAFFPGLSKQLGDKVGFFMAPGKGNARAVSLGGQGFSISAKTSKEKQELSKKFIAWFLQEDIQKKWITKDAGFTAHTGILNSEAFRQASPYNASFAESLNYVQDFWNVPVYNELLAPAQRLLGEALDGRVSPQKALDELASEHEEILRDAGLLK
jgi:multiple sugar transport system substrate-binding protein